MTDKDNGLADKIEQASEGSRRDGDGKGIITADTLAPTLRARKEEGHG